MNFEKNTLSTNTNKQLAYTHIKQGSDRICFMFCGAGYTYDKPLLYYATKVMLGKGMDVVHVHYSYSEAEFDLPFDEFAALMVKEVELVVEKVEGDYREVIFLGKSIGTIPIISHYLKGDRYSNAKFILLTPLLKKDVLFEQLTECNNAILTVIGTDDVHYVQHRVTALNEKQNMMIMEIHQANHSLDIGPDDTSASIRAMGDIMEAIGEFVG